MNAVALFLAALGPAGPPPVAPADVLRFPCHQHARVILDCVEARQAFLADTLFLDPWRGDEFDAELEALRLLHAAWDALRQAGVSYEYAVFNDCDVGWCVYKLNELREIIGHDAYRRGTMP